jgi:hypothetical protein
MQIRETALRAGVSAVVVVLLLSPGAASAAGRAARLRGVPPRPATLAPSVDARSQAAGSASVASLKGPYVLSVSGSDSTGAFQMLASFSADGQGGVSGVEDRASFAGVLQNLSFSGSYTVNPDGRGQLIFHDSGGNAGVLAFVLASADRAQVIWFDVTANVSGTLERQDPAAVSPGALQGSFAFRLAGQDGSGYTTYLLGRFDVDASGKASGGRADINEGGNVNTSALAFTGSLSPPAASGRGTLTLSFPSDTLEFVYYAVSASKLVLLERDFSYFVSSGDALRQQAGPFTTTTLSGRYAFASSGFDTSGYAVDIGQLSAGGGSLTGMLDESEATATAPVLGQTLSGSYTLSDSAAGRGTLSLNLPSGTASYVFYALDPTSALVLETDSFRATLGDLRAQAGAPLQAAALAGEWAYEISGVTVNGDVDRSGHFAADAQGALSGAEDVNAYSQTPVSASLTTGSACSVDASGHGTLTLLTPAGSTSFSFYAVSPTQLLVLGSKDGALLASGEANRQSF